jgi:chemotaxis protein CheD
VSPRTEQSTAIDADAREDAPRYRRVGGARTLVVGIADCKLSSDPRRILVTYALGSCVGVAVWNRATRAGGLLHAMLPESSLDPERSIRSPYVFVDTGLRRLIELMRAKTESDDDLVVKVAGGAHLLSGSTRFQVGQENVEAVLRVVDEEGLRIDADDTGGSGSRTMQMQLMTGRVAVRRGTREVSAL